MIVISQEWLDVLITQIFSIIGILTVGVFLGWSAVAFFAWLVNKYRKIIEPMYVILALASIVVMVIIYGLAFCLLCMAFFDRCGALSGLWSLTFNFS